MIWRSTLPPAVALALAIVTLCAAPVHAQAQQPPADTSPGALVRDPAGWVTTVFNEALFGLGRRTTNDMLGFLNAVLGDGNVISQTPAGLSYDSDAVRRMWATLRIAANAGLGVVTVLCGFNLIVHPHIRAPYHGALELVPRVLVGAVLVNTSLDWGRFAIQLNNALCAAAGAPALPGWNGLAAVDPGGLLLNLVAIGIYLIMGVLLVIQMLMRLALVDALLIVAPIALLCWVVPQAQGWARLWFNTFFGTVFVQFVQVAVLQLGAELMRHVVELLPSAAGNPIEGGRAWLASLLLGVAVLQLARTVPRLMPGYPGGGDGFGLLRTMVSRQVTSMVLGPRSAAAGAAGAAQRGAAGTAAGTRQGRGQP